MSETVDTRVVEAKFDSKQFEQGVDKTVKKLDELKKSLTDATTGKTVAEIGNKVQDATDKASNSLEKLQNRFTSFTGMLKQKLLSGIADEIVGVFFKIKNSFESLVTSMSSAQIGIGMQRYTDILTSVRTLVSAGVDQGKAYDAIERLGDYADQTSYSLDSMVATMSKFKTAGADIDTAARMIEGLSNAAASMGVNAQQAEHAYLNLQQAYSKKVMLQNDWISFESLPMVGTKFNQAIIDAAVKVGTLDPDKIDKETGKVLSYKTKKKAGTKVKSAKGITADNLGANLASRWFTDEVMEEVFGNTYYFGEVSINGVNRLKDIERKLKAQIGEINPETGEKKDKDWFNTEFQKELDKIADERRVEKLEELNDALDKGAISQEEFNKQLEEFDKGNKLTTFGYECFRAGQEARSFTDVINTLKDAISRGWAKSFELIFGQLDEAADFFTKLTESNFAEGIYAIGEFRNAVLESWRNAGGRETLLGVLEYMDEIAGSIWEKFGLIRDSEKWFEEHFDQSLYDRILNESVGGGKEAAERYKESIREEADASPFTKVAEELGQRLMILGRDIRDFFEKVHKWFTEADTTGTSRLQRISNILSGFGTVFNGVMTAAAMGLEFIGETYTKFKPVFDNLWEAIEKVLTPIFNLFNPDLKDEQGKNAYNDLQNFLDNLGKIADKIAGPLAEVVRILGDVAAFFVDMAVGTFRSNLTFFSDALGLLLEILGFGSAQTDNGKSVAKGIADDITALGNACKDAFQAVSDFFSSVIADIRTWLGLSDKTTEGGNIFTNIANWWNTNESLQTIKKSIDDFVAKVGDWITHIPENISKFAIDIGDFFKSLFYKKKTTTISPNVTITEWIKTDLLLWIEKAIEDVKTWLNDLPNNITKFGINVGDFFKSIFYTKKTITISPFTTITEWTKKDFTKDLESTLIDIGDWIKDIPNKIKNLPSLISELFNGLLYKKEKKTVVIGPNGNKQTIDVTVETELKKWLDKAILDVKIFIKDIPNKLKKLPSLISEFFKGLFYKKEKKTLVLGPNGNKAEIEVMVKTPLKEFLDTLVKTVSDFIKELPMHIHNAFVGIGDFFAMLWNELLGNGTETSTDEASDKIGDTVQKGIDNSVAKVTTNTFWDKIKAIGSDIWNGVLTIFTGNSDKEFNNNWLATKVKEGIETIGSWADTAWIKASEFIMNLPDTIAGIFTKEDGGSKEEGGIKGTIERFGKKIGEWVSSIPNTILTAWRKTENLVGKLWDSILGWITGKNAVEEELKNPDDQAAYEYLSKNGNPAYRAIAESFKKDALHNEWRKDNPILANLEDFFNNLKDYIIDKITHFPETVASGLASGASILQSILNTATGWINEDLNNEETELSVVPEGEKEENVLLKNIKAFGETIWELITTTIPAFISAGFEWISKNASSWWDALNNLFTGEGVEGKVHESTGTLGEKFKTGIENALKSIRDLFTKPLFDQKEYERLLEIDPTGYGATMYSNYANHSPIVEFFRDIIKNIVELFKNAGPAILNGIISAINWIGTKLGEATSFLDGLIKDNKSVDEVFAEKMIDKDTGKENPMWTAVKSLGETIWKMLTETLPSFISSAASYIAQQLPDLLSVMFNVGGEETSEAINEYAEDSLESLMKKRDEAIENRDYDTANKLYSEIEKRSGKTKSYNTLEAALSTFGIGEAYGEEAAQKALEQYGSILEGVEGTTEKEEDIIKKKEDLNNQLNKVNEQLVAYDEKRALSIAFTQEDVDNEKDLLEQQQKIQEELNKLGETNKNGKAATNISEAVGGLGGILSSLGNLINNPGLKTVAVLAIIAYLLESLRDIFTLSDEMEAGAYTAKWIGISAFLVGLTTMLGYMMYLAKYDPETFELISEKLEGIEAWITTILALITAIVALISGKDIVQAVKGAGGDAKSAEKTFGGFGTILTGLFSGFLKMVGAGAGFSLTTTLVGQGLENMGEAITEMFGDISIGIDNFTSILIPSISNLAGMSDQLDKANSVIEKLKEFMKGLEEVTGIIDVKHLAEGISNDVRGVSSDAGLLETTDATKFKSNLDSHLTMIFAISSFIKDLAEALKTMEDVDNPSDQIKKVNEVISSDEFLYFVKTVDDVISNVFFGTFNEMENLHNRLNWTIDTNALSAYFMILGNSLGAIAKGCSGITSENVAAITSAFEVIKQVSVELVSAVGTDQSWLDVVFNGDRSISHFGIEIELFAEYVKKFFDKIDAINLKVETGTTVDTLKYKVHYVMGVLAEMANILSYPISVSGTKEAADRMNYITAAIESLKTPQNSGSLKSFVESFGMSFNESDVDKVYNLFSAINKIGEALNYFGYGSTVSDGFERLKEIEWNDFVDIFKDINSVFNQVEEQDGNIKFSITPIIEMEDFKKQAEEMRKELGLVQDANGVWIFPDYKVTISTDGLPELIEINNKLDELSGLKQRLVNMQTIMDHFDTSLGNMRFIINGEELTATILPTIDKGLGLSTWLGARGTITTGGFVNESYETPP